MRPSRIYSGRALSALLDCRSKMLRAYARQLETQGVDDAGDRIRETRRGERSAAQAVGQALNPRKRVAREIAADFDIDDTILAGEELDADEASGRLVSSFGQIRVGGDLHAPADELTAGARRPCRVAQTDGLLRNGGILKLA